MHVKVTVENKRKLLFCVIVIIYLLFLILSIRQTQLLNCNAFLKMFTLNDSS